MTGAARGRLAAWPAVVWCTLFAAVHVFWAAGGAAGLASSAGPGLAARRPAAFVVFGLWGTAVLLAAGAGFAASAAWWPLTRGWLRLSWVLALAVGVLLVLRGIYVEVALAADLGGVRASVGPLETRWSLVLWNPWFAAGGLCFCALARTVRRRAQPGGS